MRNSARASVYLRDLELRGAGNLLGAQQHGHLDAVGYDLYIKMLNEAVLTEQGQEIKPPPECTMTLNVSAHIPASYVSSAAQRMALYKRIAQIRDQLDREDITDELLDRYGDLPSPVSNLLYVALIRALGRQCGLDKIMEEGNSVRLYAQEIDTDVWMELSRHYPNGIKLMAAPSEHIMVKMPAGSKVCDFLRDLLQKYLEIKGREV